MSYIQSYTYNPAIQKVVRKDAVVLDLAAATSHMSKGLDDLPELLGFMRVDAGIFAKKIADQIEEQTQPLRITEPGLWGVVRDEHGDDWVRSGPTPISGIEWVNSRTGFRLDFDDIPGNPTLIREGINNN